jgi:hypothetical protein
LRYLAKVQSHSLAITVLLARGKRTACLVHCRARPVTGRKRVLPFWPTKYWARWHPLWCKCNVQVAESSGPRKSCRSHRQPSGRRSRPSAAAPLDLRPPVPVGPSSSQSLPFPSSTTIRSSSTALTSVPSVGFRRSAGRSQTAWPGATTGLGMRWGK